MAVNFPHSIVFITGAFLGHNCWEEWQDYFGSAGYECRAPAWPNKDALPEELRNRHPDGAIASNRLLTLTDYYAGIINAMSKKPILIGHSIGGLIVQLLLQRDLASAGVAIHSYPPAVNTVSISFLKACWQAMGFLTPVNKSYLIPFAKWKRSITNGMSCEQQKDLYYRYAVPDSKLLLRDAIIFKSKINFDKPHAPLLLTSGSIDQLVPAAVNYDNYQKYRQADSITNYKEFDGQNHMVFGAIAWMEEADFILYWLNGINK